MAGDSSRLESILKWSLAQSDGTAPARQISEEDRKWFKEAIESQAVDIVKRMKEITMVMHVPEEKLLEQGVTVDDLAGMLEELQEHVETIDMANDLKAIGGLEPLLGYLKSPHALLRARAAEVVTTMVQNNEKSQRSVMEAGGLFTLIQMLMHDTDIVARTKALGAISSLIRHNAEGLGTFRSICGVKELVKALQPGDVRLSRKSLYLMKYLMDEFPEDRTVASDAATVKTLTDSLSASDEDIRVATADVLASVGPAIADPESRASLSAAVSARLAVLKDDSEASPEEQDALARISAEMKGSPLGASEEGGSGRHANPLLLGAPPK